MLKSRYIYEQPQGCPIISAVAHKTVQMRMPVFVAQENNLKKSVFREGEGVARSRWSKVAGCGELEV